MDELKPCVGTAFDFCGQSVRTKMLDGMPYFCLVDVCKVLDIENTRNCKARLNEDGVRSTDVIDNLGRSQQATFINESNLYKVIFQSRKPNAEKFTEWVTGEVLPAIRRDGAFVVNNGNETLEELTLRALQGLSAAVERQKRTIAEQQKQLELQAPDVAYCNDVLSANNLHNVNTVAVQLGISANRLNRFLLDAGWIYRQGGVYCPSCKIRNKGYAKYHIVPYVNSLGQTMTREHLKWTENGRKAIIELWNNRKAN
jgi:prophage antirepressor-like protein